MTLAIDAVIEKAITISPENTVSEALEIFKKANIRSLPVVDGNGDVVGLFGLRHLLKSLLPVSVTMDDGVEGLDFLVGATPGIAKRFTKSMKCSVSDFMEEKPLIVDDGTATWEALRVMALHGSPVIVSEKGSKKFVGLISRQSLLANLEQVASEIETNDE